MSDTQYLVWIIGMALATIVILAGGTLAAAGLLPFGSHDPEPDAHPDDPAGSDEPRTPVAVTGGRAPTTDGSRAT